MLKQYLQLVILKMIIQNQILEKMTIQVKNQQQIKKMMQTTKQIMLRQLLSKITQKSTKTGDQTPVELLTMGCLVSLLAIIILKKKKVF